MVARACSLHLGPSTQFCPPLETGWSFLLPDKSGKARLPRGQGLYPAATKNRVFGALGNSAYSAKCPKPLELEESLELCHPTGYIM